MMSDKRFVTSCLHEIATLLQIDGANQFKTRAFENAARTVDSLEGDLRETVESEAISQIQGIGKATGAIISELVRTGRSDYLDELRAKYPPGLLDMVRIPGLSARKVALLHDELGVETLDALEAACRSGRVARIKGFGGKTSQKILSGISFVRRNEARFLLPKGLDVASDLETLLADHPLVSRFAIGGEVRRRVEIITGVEACLATKQIVPLAEFIRAIQQFSHPGDEEGSTIRGTWSNGVPVTFHLDPPEQFPLRLFSSTGSHEYVSWALEQNAGTPREKPMCDETDLFEALGVKWLEPELREPESEMHWQSPPEVLVRREDLQGIFHMHSTWSDGRDPLDEMIAGVKERGYSYVGVSDHSKSAGYAGGLTDDRVRQQRAEIRKIRQSFPGLTIFHGTEADILGDGSIDYDKELLSELDFVIASVHSRFGMSSDEMTDRLVTALSNPWVTFLGHMTGRMLLAREGYSFDYDRVFDAAAEHGVMIEINGNPNRRDIDWRLLRRALDRGVEFSIHPDAHAVRALDNVIPGVWNARKAGLGPGEIFNTKPVEEVAEYLADRRTRVLENE